MSQTKYNLVFSLALALTVISLLPHVETGHVIGCKGNGPCQHSGPGCNNRPICDNREEPPCDNGTFFADPCWPQVFYECSNGSPVPSICPDPLIFNHNHVNGGTCDYSGPGVSPHCGCALSCAIPPTCEKVVKPPCSKVGEEPCTGALLYPHPCDCQFYWECDNQGYAHLRTCGTHSVFVPHDFNSGACTLIQDSIQENVGCTIPDAFLVAKSEPVAVVLVNPVPLPVRHPIHELLASYNLKNLLPHLAQYVNSN